MCSTGCSTRTSSSMLGCEWLLGIDFISHLPSIRIDPRHLLPRDEANEAPIVFGMRRIGEGPRILRIIRSKKFFTSNHDAFAALARVDFPFVRLQPDRVAIKPPASSPSRGVLPRLRLFFHYDSGFVAWHLDLSQRAFRRYLDCIFRPHERNTWRVTEAIWHWNLGH